MNLPNDQDLDVVVADAWNSTKAADDPEFDACAIEHKGKLKTAARAIIETGYDDTAGLEDFGAYVAGVVKHADEEEKKAREKVLAKGVASAGKLTTSDKKADKGK